MKKLIRTAVDRGKNYFQFHALAGEAVRRCRVSEASQVLQFYPQIEPCQVAMETYGSIHHCARELIAM